MFVVVESDLKHAMAVMCESDSPIKMDLSDIPRVAESEKTPFFLFLFFKQSTQNGEGRGRGGGGGLWVGGSFQNAR